MIAEAVKRAATSLGLEDFLREWQGFLCFAALDYAKLAQRALLSHQGASAPLHVFNDILDRLLLTRKILTTSVR